MRRRSFCGSETFKNAPKWSAKYAISSSGMGSSMIRSSRLAAIFVMPNSSGYSFLISSQSRLPIWMPNRYRYSEVFRWTASACSSDCRLSKLMHATFSNSDTSARTRSAISCSFSRSPGGTALTREPSKWSVKYSISSFESCGNCACTARNSGVCTISARSKPGKSNFFGCRSITGSSAAIANNAPSTYSTPKSCSILWSFP